MNGMGCLRLLAAVGGFGLLAGLAGPALAEEEPGGETVVRAPQRTILDADITNDIKAKLEGEFLLRHADVIISTQGGVVTLVGMVDTILARDRAVELAKKSGGVLYVNDMLRLNVSSPAAPMQD